MRYAEALREFFEEKFKSVQKARNLFWSQVRFTVTELPCPHMHFEEAARTDRHTFRCRLTRLACVCTNRNEDMNGPLIRMMACRRCPGNYTPPAKKGKKG